MQTERFYYRIVFFIVILCHLFTGIQFWLKLPELETPQIWVSQFYFLLTLSLLFSLLLFSKRSTSLVGKLCFVVKLIIFTVIGYAEGKYLGIEFTLLVLLIIETSAYFTLSASLFITTGLIVFTLFNQQAIIAWYVPLSRVPFHDLFSLAIYAIIVTIFANLLHVTIKKLDEQTLTTDRLNKAVTLLMDANMGFQQHAVTAGEESAIQERKRISRDIHDTAVHTFITVIMLAESAVDLLEPTRKKALGILQQLITLAKEGVQDTRQALRELRAINEVFLTGLQRIHHLIKVFREATGVQVDVDFGNAPWEFEEQIDQVLYRMIQEGLTNAFRHGKATRIIVRLWIFETNTTKELIIRIHDNGQGSSEIKKGIGLQGMEERLKKLNGRLEAKNVSDGFDVTAWIPCKRSELK